MDVVIKVDDWMKQIVESVIQKGFKYKQELNVFCVEWDEVLWFKKDYKVIEESF